MEFVGSTPVKTYDYQYDSLNRLKRSTKTIGAVAPGTAGNWTGAMTLTSATPDLATFLGGTPLQLDGDFTATFDPGTLQVFVTQTQGARDEAVDYVADLVGYTGAQIDVLAPARPEQGTFDLDVSALNGATRVYSNPVPITYGPHVIEYDLDGAGSRNALLTQFETAPDTYTDLDTAAYTESATAPPADAQMNQYTTTPATRPTRDSVAHRAYLLQRTLTFHLNAKASSLKPQASSLRPHSSFFILHSSLSVSAASSASESSPGAAPPDSPYPASPPRSIRTAAAARKNGSSPANAPPAPSPPVPWDGGTTAHTKTSC